MFDLFKRKPEQAKRVEPTIGNAIEVASSDTTGMLELFGAMPTPSGAVVNETTAMRSAAVYRATSLLAGSVAMLPLGIYKRIGAARKQIEGHPFWWMLNEEACSGWTSATAFEFMVTQVLLRGDGLAYIVRNGSTPVGLIPYPRDRVTITRISQGLRKAPRLQYGFSDIDGYFGAEQEDVIHFPGFGFNGTESMSVIQWGARNGIGIALRGDEYAGNAFANGGKPEVAVKFPNKMTTALQAEFRNAWVAKYSGNGPTGIPLLLTEGGDVKELSMSAVDQQVLESRQWQVVDIARAFGVPPHLIGETSKGTAWGTGYEQLNLAFLTFTLGPHLTRFAHELNRKLFTKAPNFVDYDRDAFMSGDSTAKSSYYQKALGGPGAQGWMSVDQVRAKENMEPMGGEFAKVIRAEAKPASDPKAKPADDTKPSGDPAPDDNNDDTENETE